MALMVLEPPRTRPRARAQRERRRVPVAGDDDDLVRGPPLHGQRVEAALERLGPAVGRYDDGNAQRISRRKRGRQQTTEIPAVAPERAMPAVPRPHVARSGDGGASVELGARREAEDLVARGASRVGVGEHGVEEVRVDVRLLIVDRIGGVLGIVHGAGGALIEQRDAARAPERPHEHVVADADAADAFENKIKFLGFYVLVQSIGALGRKTPEACADVLALGVLEEIDEDGTTFLRIRGAKLIDANTYEIVQRKLALDRIEHALKNADFFANRQFLSHRSYVKISADQIDHDLLSFAIVS